MTKSGWRLIHDFLHGWGIQEPHTRTICPNLNQITVKETKTIKHLTTTEIERLWQQKTTTTPPLIFATTVRIPQNQTQNKNQTTDLSVCEDGSKQTRNEKIGGS